MFIPEKQNNKKGGNRRRRQVPQLMPSHIGYSEDEEEEEDQHMMMPFSGFNQQMMNFPGTTSFQMQTNFGGNGGTYKSTHMSYQTYVDENGNQQVKKMERKNNRHVDEEGNVMEDREELFKDSEKGINQMKKGRRINDRGMQITKENRNGEYNEFKQFHNMEEEDMEHFIRDWRDRRHLISESNHGRMLRATPGDQRPLAIMHQHPRTRQSQRAITKKVYRKKDSKDKKKGSRRKVIRMPKRKEKS
jgi:hypothetical protein